MSMTSLMTRETQLTFFFGREKILNLSWTLDLRGASMIAQLVKNPPAMQETPVRFLGQEDPLEKG